MGKEEFRFERVAERLDGGVTVITTWYLHGSFGAVQLKGMILPRSLDDWPPLAGDELLGIVTTDAGRMMAMDLGYHSPLPMYEGHEPIAEHCPVLDKAECYYDGSGLAAQRPILAWAKGGFDESIIEQHLRSYYESVFGYQYADQATE